MNLSEKASLHRELAKLITAAFHMDRAVELLLSQKPSHARRCWLEGLRDGLKSGQASAAAGWAMRLRIWRVILRPGIWARGRRGRL
jgi:type II secretory pathway component PulF